jgi:alkanesulfonate monooxygenase SsuD/methylene tetrahydromethanopterin reductase-like flavin-dependent oxidoreductase (luciferase family)
MTVQFGIFDHIEGIPGTSMGQVLQDRLDLIKMADKAGFYAYHLAEHHGTDLCLAPNQEIFLAAAAQVTEQIRIGPLVKILPIHHPLRVVEDICLLDQLTGGRVEYGVGRGIAAIEHFWFQGDWFSSHDRFDEAIELILRGLQTGTTGGSGGQHYDFPSIDVNMSPVQTPNPPFWYPGNPVTAGRYGFNLVWPGAIPDEAYELYVKTWNEFRHDPVRACGPDAEPKVGSTLLIGCSHDEAEGKAIAARGWRGLMRRIVEVHKFDNVALSDSDAQAALNPLAHAAIALMEPGGEDMMMPTLTASSGTPAQVSAAVESIVESGRCNYVILQLPTGDMTFGEAKNSLQLFIDDVMPAFI